MAKAWKFGDDIDTDIIIAARYLNTSDEKVLAQHIMEDAQADFAKKVSHGDLIVGGENFGCGSSREHAPIALKAAGISAVLAKSFARIFYRNSFNIGLLIYELDTSEIDNLDELVIDEKTQKIINKTKGTSYDFKPVPPFMQKIVDSGGLINYAKDNYVQGKK